MAKRQKKRNKRYSGEDARTTGVAGQNKPVIHKFEAKQRNPVSQWLFEHKRGVKYSLIATSIIAFITLIVIGVVQSVSN
ncbi:MAG TPA: hypothetical protein PKD68_01860 [Candidatus Saccharibacteria bacterium]|nr:hypothetical protein [Candidatus Saccharibacteria bacterium]